MLYEKVNPLIRVGLLLVDLSFQVSNFFKELSKGLEFYIDPSLHTLMIK